MSHPTPTTCWCAPEQFRRRTNPQALAQLRWHFKRLMNARDFSFKPVPASWSHEYWLLKLELQQVLKDKLAC